MFHHVEEPMEIHLSILDGIKDRYETPYFDNLKKYAQRPIGTFHALPIARGKSVFRSNWIRDMGQFYGTNIFFAESSRHDRRPRQPARADRQHQEDAGSRRARLRRASAPTSAPTAPRPRTRSSCRRSASRATSSSSTATATSRTTTASCSRGAQPYYVEAYPADAVLDVRRGAAARRSRRRCSTAWPRASSTGSRSST